MRQVKRQITVIALIGVIGCAAGYFGFVVPGRTNLVVALKDAGISKPHWESRIRARFFPNGDTVSPALDVFFPDASLLFAISSPVPEPDLVASLIAKAPSIEVAFLMDESAVLPRAILESICNHEDVENLSVVQVPFAPEDWQVIARSKSVRVFELESTTVTDEVMFDLAKMKNVEVLSLRDIPLTPKCIAALKSWKSLRVLEVMLDDPQMSPQALKMQLPGVEIR